MYSLSPRDLEATDSGDLVGTDSSKDGTASRSRKKVLIIGCGILGAFLVLVGVSGIIWLDSLDTESMNTKETVIGVFVLIVAIITFVVYLLKSNEQVENGQSASSNVTKGEDKDIPMLPISFAAVVVVLVILGIRWRFYPSQPEELDGSEPNLVSPSQLFDANKSAEEQSANINVRESEEPTVKKTAELTKELPEEPTSERPIDEANMSPCDKPTKELDTEQDLNANTETTTEATDGKTKEATEKDIESTTEPTKEPTEGLISESNKSPSENVIKELTMETAAEQTMESNSDQTGKETSESTGETSEKQTGESNMVLTEKTTAETTEKPTGELTTVLTEKTAEELVRAEADAKIGGLLEKLKKDRKAMSDQLKCVPAVGDQPPKERPHRVPIRNEDEPPKQVDCPKNFTPNSVWWAIDDVADKPDSFVYTTSDHLLAIFPVFATEYDAAPYITRQYKPFGGNIPGDGVIPFFPAPVDSSKALQALQEEMEKWHTWAMKDKECFKSSEALKSPFAVVIHLISGKPPFSSTTIYCKTNKPAIKSVYRAIVGDEVVASLNLEIYLSEDRYEGRFIRVKEYNIQKCRAKVWRMYEPFSPTFA